MTVDQTDADRADVDQTDADQTDVDQTDVERADDVDESEDADEAGQAEDKAPRRRGLGGVVRLPSRFVRAVGRFSRRKSMQLITVFGVLALLLCGGVGWLAWLGYQDNATADARGAATDAARSSVVAALSYNYNSFDADVAKAHDQMTGQFRDEYGQLMSQTVAGAAKSQRTITAANVVSSAVISASPGSVDLLVFVNQTTTSNAFSGPKLDGSRVRLTMTKTDGKWLLSSLTPV